MIWNRKYIIVLHRHADIALPFPAYSHCLYQSFFDAWQELPYFCVAKKFAAFLQWTIIQHSDNQYTEQLLGA